jgi:hypothetical protein
VAGVARLSRNPTPGAGFFCLHDPSFGNGLRNGPKAGILEQAERKGAAHLQFGMA